MKVVMREKFVARGLLCEFLGSSENAASSRVGQS